jgi:hypothetical protein
MKRPGIPSGAALLALLSVAACGGGGGGSNAGTTSFQLLSSSVRDGAVWEINREIVLAFSEEVDFGTVSANTINIRSSDDAPATGVFKLRDTHTVVFQPTCPTQDDYSDAGLQPGGVVYTLRLPGHDTSANVLRSKNGVALGIGQSRTFSTPASTVASVAFQDTVQGPPEPVVRDQGTSGNSTLLEIGGDADNPVYFERDGLGDLVLSQPGFQVPLNLYSDPAARVAVVIEFNQPVNPSTSNISESRLRLEFLDSTSAWVPIDTRVILVENCTETGARVRLEPIGILPPASEFRAVVLGGFQDLVGEANLSNLTAFAVAPTLDVDFTSLTPADELSDAFADGFDFGGSSSFSFEDTQALFDSPSAEWGDGKLAAAFSFDGRGGPNGNFDWVIRTGEIFFFDTVSQKIIGGPDGVPQFEQTCVNGVVDVRDLHIEEGGEIRVQGPNTMKINATGEVRIDGRLDLGGFNAKDVATLNTGNQVEIGGAGAAGGGKGGSASEIVTSSTPRGGRGDGPFRSGRLGGDGGETGFSNDLSTNGKDTRRPGGGGGGRFAKNYTGTIQPTTISVEAKKGGDGHTLSTGAISGIKPAKGGEPGDGPFLDASDENNFFGTRPVVSGGTLVGLVRGELPSLWAGYGGGGGGNANPAARFPTPNWNFGSDEKGGGGGGSAGGIHIKALGRIVFGIEGEVNANGGRGGTGENTNFLDHIGGTGGGGSGGHIILESASQVDFSDNGTITTGISFEFVQAGGPPTKIGGTDYVNSCCRTFSNGGAGGPGIIQIHVPDNISPPSDAPTADIRIPTHLVGQPEGLDLFTTPPPYVMIPTFGARSKARSDWISIGGADQNPGGSESLVRFLFDGIETTPGPDEGKVRVTGTTVDTLDPLTAHADLADSTEARILADGFTLEIEGSLLDAIRTGTTAGISNDIYLRTPALLRDFALRLRVEETPGNFEDFPIVDASYDEGGASAGDEVLRMTVTTERGPLTGFNAGGTLGTTGFLLIPRFFLVRTEGLDHAMPTTSFVRLKFQATTANLLGAPDEQNPLVDWTADIAQFNALAPGELQFFRFEVEFDLDSQAAGVSANTVPVTLDFLKIPFVF